MLKNNITGIQILILLLFLGGCSEPGYTPVKNFKLDRYLGTWYEIARMPNRFEEGMIHVTANYSLKGDGSVKVINSGLKEGKLKTAEGKAKFSGDAGIGHLRVSFFGPFYGDYLIVELDHENYSWAMVISSEKYLWILARKPSLDNEITDKLVKRASNLGFATDLLYFTPQAAEKNTLKE